MTARSASQDGEPQLLMAHEHGFRPLSFEVGAPSWTPADAGSRGLQNCLRGAVEASWVGSINIHPAKPGSAFAFSRGIHKQYVDLPVHPHIIPHMTSTSS